MRGAGRLDQDSVGRSVEVPILGAATERAYSNLASASGPPYDDLAEGTDR